MKDLKQKASRTLLPFGMHFTWCAKFENQKKKCTCYPIKNSGWWEEEFIDKFCGTGRFVDFESFKEVEAFIQTLLNQAVETERERISKELRGEFHCEECNDEWLPIKKHKVLSKLSPKPNGKQQ